MTRLHSLGGTLLLLVCLMVGALLLVQTSVAKETSKLDKAAAKKTDKVETTKQTTTESTSTTSAVSTNQTLTTNQTVTTDQTIVTTPTITTPRTIQRTTRLTGEQINWWVLSSGGGSGSSTNYAVNGTIGQIAVGLATSTNYIVKHGYWQDFLTGPPTCCLNNRGNANNDPEDKANVSDVTYLVSWLFGIPTGPEPVCIEEANANSDPEEKANVSDITYLTAWLFGIPTGPEPGACP